MSASRKFAHWLTGNWAGRLVLLILASSALGFLFALPSMAASNERSELLPSLAEWWTWGLMFPVMLACDRLLTIPGKHIGRRAVANLVASLVLTLPYLYLFAAMRAAMGIESWSALLPSHFFRMGLFAMYLWSLLIYWMISGGMLAWRYYQRYVASELRLERLERSFSEARLNALRMQLDPHFLFNALNTISSHVERDPKLTRRMIEHLGDLLRMSLESKDKQQVPLGEEIAFLEHYLAIQRIRFGDQLKVELRIAPEVRYASVPSLVIQPLVENAIRHGISRRGSGGTVTVWAGQVDDRLEIRVMDDGVGLPPGWTLEKSAGLGLSVTRERIAGIHPNGNSRFSVRRRGEGGTEVAISLPMRVNGVQEHGVDAA
jgi:two-component system LytT family sensor kinase